MVTRSKKPSKQRKAHFRAPIHRRYKMMSAHLSPELREKHGFRSLPVVKGDRVRIMRGKFGKLKIEGRVQEVDLRRLRIYVENATFEKEDGVQRFYPIHPSNVMITKLNTKDRLRRERINKRKVKKELVEEPPEEELVEEIEEGVDEEEVIEEEEFELEPDTDEASMETEKVEESSEEADDET